MKIFIVVLVCFLLGLSVWLQFLQEQKSAEPKYWSKFFRDMNFRDVGVSLQQCSQDNIRFSSGLMFRSTKYFSGWSCHDIGNPHDIFTLNYKPSQPQEYYCEQADGVKHFGMRFNKHARIRTRDLSSVAAWRSMEFNSVFCNYTRSIIDDLMNEKSLLIHCSAGRDRTGMLVGIIAASLMEQKDIPFETIVSLNNCDYQKTASLVKEKYGLLETTLINMKKDSGSISDFLIKTCHIDSSSLKKAATNFIKSN